jgi:hypothetical protein
VDADSPPTGVLGRAALRRDDPSARIAADFSVQTNKSASGERIRPLTGAATLSNAKSCAGGIPIGA